MKPAQAIRLGALGAAVAGMLATGGSAAWAAVPQSAAAGSPATLILQTVPALKGVAVSLDGSTYRTGASGSVTIPATSGLHRIRILHPAMRMGSTSVRFARWLDGIALTSRRIVVAQGVHVQQAGFVVSRPIAFRFTDGHGRPVPLPLVDQVTMTNGVGQRFAFPAARPPRLFAMDRVIRGTSGLLAVPIRYSVRTVTIDGSDVVFGGSQYFYVSQRLWAIKVMLFPLQVKVRDALFKFPIAYALRLTLPNGSHRIVRLGDGHNVLVPGLPRGIYSLVAQGPGIGLSAPVTLSGPQTDTLLMLSWIDLLVIAAFAVLFLVGLPLVGGRIARKPGRGRRLMWRSDPARRPLTTHAHAGVLAKEATPGSRHDLADAGAGAVGGTGVLHATKVMPAVWEVTVPATRARGRRRRPR